MSGIVGVIGKRAAQPLLVDVLRRLEYRGYDSAGLATIVDGRIERRRVAGRISQLEALLTTDPLPGQVGIGHTRWATFGAPTKNNAHPISDGRVAIVQNGIIENFNHLRTECLNRGYDFETETDTEVVVHLISSFLADGLYPQVAVQNTLAKLQGLFALAILFSGYDNFIIGAQRGSPLVVGYGDDEMYLASDGLALAPWTHEICYLEEGDWVELTSQGAVLHDTSGTIVERATKFTATSGAMIAKGDFSHFMLKEIHEQPAVLADTIRSYLDPSRGTVTMPPMPYDPVRLSSFSIAAAGSSYHAALVAGYWLEQWAQIPVYVELASEFRYRKRPLGPGGVSIFISQSGETADTIAALMYAKQRGQYTIAVINVPESSMARRADVLLPTFSGPEIGVANTKSFTCQLCVLALFSIFSAAARRSIDRETEKRLCEALSDIPGRVQDVLRLEGRLAAIARRLAQARSALYLGRGTGYPIALEGALKLKEICYIHAEGYAAGEMKHGPIALIDESMSVIVVAPSDELFEKSVSNIQEVIARGGQVILLSDPDGIARIGNVTAEALELPHVDPFVAPILYVIPMQLLAYHVAIIKGTDVDQPRNLAKSVTVE